MSEVLRRIGTVHSGAAGKRPPVFLLILASSFAGYFLLLLYCDLKRPENPGFTARPTAAGMIVDAVSPDTAAWDAGIQAGDRILAMNGVRIASADAWSAIGTNAQIGVAMPLLVERQGQSMTLSMTLSSAPPGYWRRRAGIVLLISRTAQFLTLLAGLIVLWRRPRDPVALTASWFLLTCAVFSIALPLRFATVWRELPALLGGLLWIPYASSLTIGPVLLTFVAAFPRRLPHAATVLAATWIAAGAAVAAPLYNFGDVVYNATELRSVGPGTGPLLAVTIISLVAAVVISVVNYRRMADLNERRKLRAVVAGIATGVLPGFAIVASYWFAKRANLSASLFDSPALALAAVAMLAAPLSITYAVLRHRLFDIGFIIRQGVRYALARRLLLSLIPALGAIAVVDLLAHGDETVNAVVQRRGPMYAALGAAATAMYVYRRRWLDALDRRFFRERHAGYAVLRGVAEQLRRAVSLDEVAPRVVATIEAAMHPEFAALLVRNRRANVFRTTAAAPVGGAPQDLPADSKLVALARVLEQPLDTSEDADGTLLRQLPPADLDFVKDTGTDLLIPVVTTGDQLYGLLALGRKRSEEPYSREDRDLLVTIAENVALLAARSAPARETPGLEECLECGECFDAGARVCDRDARPLVGRGLPRTLAGRYRLDRRIGAGGMGTVYEALDTALDRVVATKVIREDLVATATAADRFFEEARIAARLVHPNIVTVHDFGIVEGRQPFFVMERLVGRTLREEIDTNQYLSPGSVLAILAGICAAVDVAHRARLVHRDLKPENIFLCEGDVMPVPKVLDFGVAKPLLAATDPTVTGNTRPGALVGTPEYMSPEQLRGEPPTSAWDLWSLAIITLEMLESGAPTGQPALHQTTATASRASVGLWDPGATLREELPHCAQFFARALALDAQARPADGRSFLNQLEHALRADGVYERPRPGRHEHVLLRG